MRCLVTAIGSMSSETVVRTITRQSGTALIGCGIYPREWTAAARLIERFHQVPSAKDSADYLKEVLRICKEERISHIIPLTDPEVDVISEGRHHFEATGVKICIPPQPAIRLARDKFAIHQRFSDHPRIRPIPTTHLMDERATQLSWPLLAKPRFGRSSEGHVAVPNTAALQFHRSELRGEDYVIQPYFHGDVYVVDVVRQIDGGGCVAVTRRELLRTTNGAGMTVRMQPDHKCNALAMEAAEIIDLHGCVNLEFLVVDDRPLLMDINPRFSAGVAFSLMAGYDMVSNHLRCFSGSQIEPATISTDSVYTRGLVEYST